MEITTLKKICAVQVAPEHQESELMRSGFPSFDEHYIDVIITGNDRYNGYTTNAFNLIQDELINGCGHLSKSCGEGVDSDGIAYAYKNITEAVHDCFPPQHKRKYSTQDIKAWQKLFDEYEIVCKDGTWSQHEKNVACRALELMTGKPYTWKCITGSCQGDWQYVLYPHKEVSANAIKALEAQYFNTGTEWIVHDDICDEDLDDDSFPSGLTGGNSVYCHTWGEESIRNELASYVGCDPSNIVMYEFKGYRQTPIYKLIA